VTFRFQIVVPGDTLPQINLGFSRMGLRVKDLRPAWREIHQYLLGAQKEQFDTQGKRGGERWRALSPAYAAKKLKRWGSKPTLQASGRMYRAFTTRNPHHVEVSRHKEMRFGVKDSIVPQAKWHQSGTVHMPRRAPFRLTRKDQEFIEETLVETIRDEFLKATRGAS